MTSVRVQGAFVTGKRGHRYRRSCKTEELRAASKTGAANEARQDMDVGHGQVIPNRPFVLRFSKPNLTVASKDPAT